MCELEKKFLLVAGDLTCSGTHPLMKKNHLFDSEERVDTPADLKGLLGQISAMHEYVCHPEPLYGRAWFSSYSKASQGAQRREPSLHSLV